VRVKLAATYVLALMLLTGAGICAGDLPPADAAPDRVEITLDRCRLLWQARQGLDVEYNGVPVFAAYPDELTLHTRDWKQCHYRSGADAGGARLTTRGATQVLTVEHDSAGLRWSETITAGPGDRFRVEYEYAQDAWDDAALQVGFSQPLEHWFAAAAFEADTSSKRADGIIPVAFDPARPQPFDGARRVIVRSLFGQVEITAARPVSLFDYQQRNGRFWLGLDEPLPKGEKRTFAIEVRFTPAELRCGPIALSRLQLPARVDDGRLTVSATARALQPSPAPVKVILTATSPRGERAETVSEMIPARDSDAPLAMALPALEPGVYTYRLTVADAGGATLFASKEMKVQALPTMTVLPGRSLYTAEQTGCLLVTVSPALKGRALRFTATGGGDGVRIEAEVKAGARTRIPLDVARLPQGVTRLTAQLTRGGDVVGIAGITLRKAPPKPNEVKVDYENRGLIVDGLPFFPCGFYCVFPAADLAAAEAPQGFNMIAAYQDAARDPDQIRAYMDRCAQVGMKVHYDIRAIAQAEPSPAKWEALRREVEMLRDHPALLAWYLCDEPDGQGIAPARLVEAYNFIKDLDPYHPITMVFCIPQRAPEYVEAMDIMMADPYPIPDNPVTTVADWADQLNRAVGYGMPLWIVPQAFGGGELWRREPSAREERAMTYLALVHGATGLQYFIRRAPIGNPISPSLWSECRRLALEVQELTPALLASAHPEVRCDAQSVHVTARAAGGSLWVIAVNAANDPKPIRITTREPFSGTAEVMFERRQVSIANGKLADMIDGFGTRVYRIPVNAPAPSKVSAANLTANPSFEKSANPGTPDGCYVTIGKDPGASLFIDPRVAHDGTHSLRLRTPVEGMGVTIRAFPVELAKGRKYAVSVWGKGQVSGLKFALGLDGVSPPQTFELTTEWKKYEFSGAAAADARPYPTLSFISAGTAWFDLLEVVPRTAPSAQ